MRTFTGFSLIFFALGALADQPALILETAPLGTTNGGTSISPSQYLGARFTISQPALISGVGGHVKSYGTDGEDRTIFVSIAPVTTPEGFPSDTTLSESLFSATLEPPYNLVGPYPYQVPETIVPTDFVVPAGNYAIVFGSGLFGATGSAWMPLSGPIQSLPWFFSMNRNSGDYWRNLNEQPMRFVVEALVGIDNSILVKLQDAIRVQGNRPMRVNALLMSTLDLDATQIDPASLRFGQFEEPIARYKLRDVNRDGLVDLQFSVETKNLPGTEGRALVQGSDYSGNRVAGFLPLRFEASR